MSERIFGSSKYESVSNKEVDIVVKKAVPNGSAFNEYFNP